MTDLGRAEEVNAFLAILAEWAPGRPDVRAIALVGSWAYGRPRADSDLDVVLLTTDPGAYINREDWLPELGGVRLIKTAKWGPVTERRFALDSGLEIELGVGTVDWAATAPVDDGTRRVVTDGMRCVYDPDGLLTALEDACQQSP